MWFFLFLYKFQNCLQQLKKYEDEKSEIEAILQAHEEQLSTDPSLPGHQPVTEEIQATKVGRKQVLEIQVGPLVWFCNGAVQYFTGPHGPFLISTTEDKILFEWFAK